MGWGLGGRVVTTVKIGSRPEAVDGANPADPCRNSQQTTGGGGRASNSHY